MKNKIIEYLNKTNSYNNKLKEQSDKIIEIVKMIKNSDKIFICGNGGSSATASHFANDLQKICGLNVLCLTDNVPVMTAYANDDGYENIFVEQMKNLISYGIDNWHNTNQTLIVITGSGKSKNIMNAIWYALRHDMKIIAFVGMDGGFLVDTKRIVTPRYKFIHIESEMLHSEDWHLTLCHLISTLI